MSKYPYELIPQDADIRILRILAGCSAEILCELKPIKFGSLPYLALSYVWGSYEAPSTMPKIMIQEKTPGGSPRAMAVRRNLFGALEQLRHPTMDVHCWADGICIDFENVEERESQLALARHIYEKAERVMHWLGRQEEYTFNAFKCIRILREPRFEQNLAAERCQQLRCFQQLLANAWFSRRWIIQEVVFARSAVLFSGSCSIYWSVFKEAADNYFAFQDRQAPALLKSHTEGICRHSTQAAKVLLTVTSSISRQSQSKPWERLRAFRKASAGREFFAEDAQPEARNFTELSNQERELIEDYEKGSTIEYRFTLEELIYILYPHDVSDYRDVIYAVLSLAEDTNRRQPATAGPIADSNSSPRCYHSIQPDYRKDVFEVLKDFTEYCTQRQSTYPLDVICRPWVPRSIQRMIQATEPSNHNIADLDRLEELRTEGLRWVYARKLASWMPTTERLAFDYTQATERRNADSLVGPPDRPIYHATKSVAADISFGESIQHNRSSRQKSPLEVPRPISDGTLSARGIQLDVMDSLSSQYSGIIAEDWLLLGGWSSQQSIPDALWRTMAADRDPSEGASVKPEFREACKRAVECRDEHNNIDTSSLICHGNDMISKFLRRVNDVAWNRRLFRTKKLKRLGLAPLHAAEGDILSVLYGCSVPVILRRLTNSNGKETGGYELVGECYLDGMMDGEAVSESYLEQARKDGSEKIFVLR